MLFFKPLRFTVLIATLLTLTFFESTAQASPSMTQANEQASTRLADTLNQFTFHYFKRMPKKGGVVAASPYHLFTMLSALSHYTEGDNQADMKRLLGIPIMSPVLHRLSHLNHYITPQRQGADAIWVNQTESYKDLNVPLSIKYLVHVATLDFRHQSRASSQAIKTWSLNKTHLNHWHFPYQMVDSHTQLLLTSLIKGNMIWEYPFHNGRTKNAAFYHAEKKHIVPTMHQKHFFPYYEASDFQLAIFPLHDQLHALAIILPKKNVSLNQVTKHFNQAAFLNALKQIKYKDLDVTLPRISVTLNTQDIQQTLQSMGMEIAFQRSQRYHGLSYKPILLSNVIQSTHLIINEHGYHAGKHTSKNPLPAISEPKQYIAFHANHPFLFFVFDFDTNTISLIGQVNNPAS